MKSILFPVILMTVAVCSSQKNHLRSGDYQNKEEKIAVLKQYFNVRTQVLDAEFDIYDVNMNASLSIPGPTHRDYQVALLLKKEDAEKYLSDVVLTSFPKDSAWCRRLLMNNKNFHLKNEKDFWTYTGDHKLAFYFEKECILCIRIYQD